MKKKGERELVNLLVKSLLSNSRSVYVHIDRDSGAVRHTSSGWDFLVAQDSRIAFCEAKIGKGKLTEWQEFTRVKILCTDTKYHVIRFADDGLFFTINDGLPLEILRAKIQDFL